jgi:hypothetical protein
VFYLFFKVFFFSSTIFQDAKVAISHIPFAVIGTNAVNVLMTVIAVGGLSFNTEIIGAFNTVLATLCWGHPEALRT